jgi:peptidoglycan/LPS O-acetylase OafA/YrhL
MSNTQQPEPAGTGATGIEAAAELADIRRRQEQVINASFVPGWVWWAYAAAVIAMGAALDSGKPVVEATVIPLAALVIVVLAVAGTPSWRHRVKVHGATQRDGRFVAAIFLMDMLVVGVAIAIAAGLAANHVHYPATIGCAAGAAVLVIAGPLVNRYGRRLMLRQARQQLNEARQPGGSTS